MGEGAQLTQAEAGNRYEVFHTDCPARDVVDHVTSRWGIWVLISLRSNDLRFYELRDSIQGISEKMLAQTLRALVQDGLVWREVEPTTPPQVTYGLTEFGQDVGEPLTDLFDRITQRLPPSGTSAAERLSATGRAKQPTTPGPSQLHRLYDEH
ncbi:winged helix-turn-helix transcriptional regulator [Streptomyces mirabilis]|uniref:winged helix-turn-helix transcriptional regulator n=2 Tax=Streptomyces mirabilis TaxID=68239 RepID=UPI0022523D5D|nr:helix-turn-helix domain-containing protein [Streptomyces mirabilis]MCX4426001.1 helix-turn-helix transcriptional regulator [Streptomyces mirabilis]